MPTCFVSPGDSTANPNDGDVVGLMTAADVVEESLTQAQKIMADDTLGAFTDYIDGLHALDESDLRIIASAPAYQLWAKTIHAAAVDNQTVSQFLKDSGLTYSVRAGLASNTSADSFAAYVGRGREIEGGGGLGDLDGGSIHY